MTERERLRKLIDVFIDNEDYKSEDLADYLLENGVMVPPCKIGDMVYILFDDEIEEGTVINVMREKDKKGDVFYVFTVRHKKGSVNNCMTVCEEDMFLSREEAEQALIKSLSKAREKNATV